MKKLLIDTLLKLGYPVFLHGSMSEDEQFPPTFFTYTTVDTQSKNFYDDETENTEWVFQVILYSNDPETLEIVAEKSRQELIKAGFIPDGKGNDIISEEPTHTGWICNYTYLEKY